MTAPTAPVLPPLSARDHVRGPALGESAAHTLVHYGDFECPQSRQVHILVRSVLKAFPADVRFAFRHFPLRQHAHALAAAEAAEAAGALGAFWPMHDRLLENQLDLTDADLARHAQALGLDTRAVVTALREGVHRETVLAHKRAAVRAGIRSSFNLFVDGRLFQDEAVEDALVEGVYGPLKGKAG